MNFYATFSIPFIVGVVTMFVVLIVKYGSWIFGLSAADRIRIVKGIPSRQTPLAVWEVVRESLLHRRIFKVNPLLGYMHMSLAFGWFLLIVVGWIETVAYLGFRYVPLHGHVFFKYFATELPHKPVFDFLMDLLLLFVLSGVTLAFGKRIYSQAMGMHRTTRHVLGDRIALSVLWLIFPARLLAESITCALHGGGGFLTGTIGEWMAHHVNPIVLQTLYEPLWCAYSICLGLFFIVLPFSRYMHIFTEIPLIFLRRYKLHSTEKEGSFDRFQTDACSRCGDRKDIVKKLQSHKVDTRYIRTTPDGMGMWLAIFDNTGDVTASISKRPDLSLIADILDEQGDEIFSQADSILLEIDMEKDIVKRTFALAEKYRYFCRSIRLRAPRSG